MHVSEATLTHNGAASHSDELQPAGNKGGGAARARTNLITGAN